MLRDPRCLKSRKKYGIYSPVTTSVRIRGMITAAYTVTNAVPIMVSPNESFPSGESLITNDAIARMEISTCMQNIS